MSGGQKRTRDGRVILRVDPATLRPLFDSFETHLEEYPSYAEKLTFVKELIEWFQECCRRPTPVISVSATDFDTIKTAVDAVEVIYDRHSEKHVWQLRENDDLSDGQLSPWADTCITEIKSSPYFQLTDTETTCRTILDVVFCDRLKRRNDHESERCLNWLPEVTLSVKSKLHNSVIQGTVDRCLAYGNSNAALQAALIVMEAKIQLIIYLAAIQDSRKESEKTNCSVFGLVTDSEEYRFAYLDETRKLFVSDTYLWVTKKAKIIRWIDKILRDSIEACSSQDTCEDYITTMHTYRTHLNRGYQFAGIDESQVVEGEDLRSYRVIKRGPYGEIVEELETDEVE
ncbi:hypothetical protein V1525DRAFT_457031 [Lipomyces kononenkoae]|uniref:Uncharacterized protein n=1 Tax=Lipomyces kononenkoae TaxID=34357 RepID=A0ACC3SZJ0_LIPKO